LARSFDLLAVLFKMAKWFKKSDMPTPDPEKKIPDPEKKIRELEKELKDKGDLAAAVAKTPESYRANIKVRTSPALNLFIFPFCVPPPALMIMILLFFFAVFGGEAVWL
jgi:hypothetical protein